MVDYAIEVNEVSSRIVYEDNHYLVYNKRSGDLVQGDQSGDASLLDLLRLHIGRRDSKPGRVFLEAVHRIDRPVSGGVLFAKTSKGLARMSEQFRRGSVRRCYWAITESCVRDGFGGGPEGGRLEGNLLRNRDKNKSYVVSTGRSGSQPAGLTYRLVGHSDRYWFYEVVLESGRHHQVRVLLSHAGAVIRGDLKYGARRSLPGGGIGLHSRELSFTHPVRGEGVRVVSSPPADPLWALFESLG